MATTWSVSRVGLLRMPATNAGSTHSGLQVPLQSDASTVSMQMSWAGRVASKGDKAGAADTLCTSGRRKCRGNGGVVCSASSNQFTSPKTGVVGADRFKQDAVAGTYWGPAMELGEEVTLRLDTGSDLLQATARVGENLLRVAESVGAMVPDQDFCFEGTCSKCEMEVEGGAKEVGYRADPGSLDVVRSCLCPVPGGRLDRTIKMLNEEDVWGDGVL